VEGSKVDFVLASEAPAPAGYPACRLDATGQQSKHQKKRYRYHNHFFISFLIFFYISRYQSYSTTDLMV
jgi:hypothetical protein